MFKSLLNKLRTLFGGGESPEESVVRILGKTKQVVDKLLEPRGTVVIGQEMADAHEAEAEHQRRASAGPSPMPQGEYQHHPSQLGLLRPQLDPFDDQLAALARKFAQADTTARDAMRTTISMDEFYTLLAFSRRSAVFAMRERTPERVIDGLRAIAMIEEQRVDYRDILWALAILHYAAGRVGADPRQLFQDAACLAEHKTAEAIASFAARDSYSQSLRGSWGYDEIELDGQIGLIGWGGMRYKPERNLAQAAVAIADLLLADGCVVHTVEIATDIRSNLIDQSGPSGDFVGRETVRGCASVATYGHPTNVQSFFPPHLLNVYVAETTTVAEAKQLHTTCSQYSPKHFARLTLAVDDLFCLIVANSTNADVEPAETAETLSRFEPKLDEILKQFSRWKT